MTECKCPEGDFRYCHGEIERLELQLDEEKRVAASRKTMADNWAKQCEAAELQVRLWHEYAAFLGENLGTLVLFASAHGWECPEAVVAKGRALRAKLGVDDGWQLIEKRVEGSR